MWLKVKKQNNRNIYDIENFAEMSSFYFENMIKKAYSILHDMSGFQNGSLTC